MLSINLKILKTVNTSKIHNNFNLVQKYDLSLNKNNISYSNYLPTINSIVYSNRDPKDVTCFANESTHIFNISKNQNKMLFKLNNISHNLAIFNFDNNFIGFGGVYSTSHKSKNNFGIYFLKFDTNLNILEQKPVINKKISRKTGYSTTFDSNISCLKYQDKYYLYTRFNEGVGKRRTQIFISDQIDNNYSYFNTVNFDQPNIYSYTQNIFIENGIFIGYFRFYTIKKTNKHDIYSQHIGILIAYSFDGVNFIVDNKTIFDDYNQFDLIVNNVEQKTDTNFIFKNNLRNKKFSKYKIRKGGYTSFISENENVESLLSLEINDIKHLLLNYTINNEGFIKIEYLDQDKTVVDNIELEGDKTNFSINIPECNIMEITFFKAIIYQIL